MSANARSESAPSAGACVRIVVVKMRSRLIRDMNAVAAGEDPKGGIRDPAVNPAIQLPVISRQELTEGYTLSELMANAALQRVHMRHRLQYGQPEAVARAYEAAMGFTLETAGFVETKPAK